MDRRQDGRDARRNTQGGVLRRASQAARNRARNDPLDRGHLTATPRAVAWFVRGLPVTRAQQAGRRERATSERACLDRRRSETATERTRPRLAAGSVAASRRLDQPSFGPHWMLRRMERDHDNLGYVAIDAEFDV